MGGQYINIQLSGKCILKIPYQVEINKTKFTYVSQISTDQKANVALLTQLTSTQRICIIGLIASTNQFLPEVKTSPWTETARSLVANRSMNLKEDTLLEANKSAKVLKPKVHQDTSKAENLLQITETQKPRLSIPDPKGILFVNENDRVYSYLLKMDPPAVCFLVKVPRCVDFNNLNIIFDRCKVLHFTEGPAMVQPILLENHLGYQLPLFCLFDLYDKNDQEIIATLAETQQIYLCAISDKEDFSLLGAKLLHWTRSRPTQMRDQTKNLMKTQRNPRKYLKSQKLRQRFFQTYTFYKQFQEATSIQSVLLTTNPDYKDRAKIVCTIEPDSIEVQLRSLPSHLQDNIVDTQKLSASEISQKIDPIAPPISPVAIMQSAANLGTNSSNFSYQEKYLPLLERCTRNQERQGEATFKNPHDSLFSAYWHTAIAKGLRMSRSLILDPSAISIIKKQQQNNINSPYGPDLSSFPRHHLWLEFEQEQQILFGKETAALFLFAAHDDALFSPVNKSLNLTLGQYRQLMDHLLTEDQGYMPLMLISWNKQGHINWVNGYSLDLTNRSQKWPLWHVPHWHDHTCLSKKCRFFSKTATGQHVLLCTPCNDCLNIQRSLLAWAVAFWQLLESRPPAQAMDFQLSNWWNRLGKEHLKNIPAFTAAQRETTHQYRIVSRIDLQSPRLVHPQSTETQGQGYSWLEATDPSQIETPVRDIPAGIRILRHRRYAKYIRENGNQLRVKAHQRKVPRKHRSTLRVTEVVNKRRNFSN